MKTVEIFALCMVIAVVSFLGFVVENVWLSVTKGFIDNRNMCLPFLIGYGLAMVAIYLLFGTPGNVVILGRKFSTKTKMVSKVIYFLAVMFCVCLGEIVLGKLVERLCHFYWWDYSRLPMHITRYTSIPTSMAFSLLIVIFMEYFFAPLFHCFLEWDYGVLRFSAVALMTLMTADYIYNAFQMYRNKKMVCRWRIDTTNTRGYRLLHSQA